MVQLLYSGQFWAGKSEKRIERGFAMCDYSLFAVPNRLAEEGENLVAHRFLTGSMGLASPAGLAKKNLPPRPASIWAKVRSFFFGNETPKPVPAVCVAPGTRMRMQVPHLLQAQYSVESLEEVTFTQLSASAYAYRDAVRFENGKTVSLQDVPAGTEFRVLRLANTNPEWEPFREEATHAYVRR